jgi:3-(3-hydroxy-phenyl)propionate hydroxylase
VLFAGDAAHLVPIFGVRGANSGIDDADNLTWKLAFVIKGLASSALLDSYSAERVAAAHENLSYGTKSTEFMAPPSFAFDLMRTAVLGLAKKHPSLSSLINRARHPPSPMPRRRSTRARALGRVRAGPMPGCVLPECPLTPGGWRGHARRPSPTSWPRFTALYFSEDVPRRPSWTNSTVRWQQAGAVQAGVADPTPRRFLAHGWDPQGALSDVRRPARRALSGAADGRARPLVPGRAAEALSAIDRACSRDEPGDDHDRHRTRRRLHPALQDDDAVRRTPRRAVPGALRRWRSIASAMPTRRNASSIRRRSLAPTAGR